MRPFACVVAVLGCLPLLAQEEAVIRTTTNEVLLDVVVRARNGRVVRDLRPEEIEVYEDGVRQNTRAFRFAGEARAAAGEPEAPAPAPIAEPGAARPPLLVNPLREPTLLSIVFHAPPGGGFGLDHMRLARQAALELMNQQLGPNTYIGVYWVTGRLTIVQPYTQDRAALAAAVEAALSMKRGDLIGHSLNLERQMGVSFGGLRQGSTLLPAEGTVGPEFRGMLADMMMREYMEEGYAQSLRGLMALRTLVEEQARFRGRKTVLLISSGLLVHPATTDLLREVAAGANRANVTFYALDAQGLSIHSRMAMSRAFVNRAAEASKNETLSLQSTQQSPSQVRESVLVPDFTLAGLRENTQLNLADFAAETGGFLIADTNEVRKNVARLGEDIRSHYEVAYSPAITTLDGKFHAVTVKVNRPGVQVRTRSGYFALPQMLGRSLMTYELANLKTLNQRPLPREFEFSAGAVRFRSGPQAVEYNLAVEVPISGLTVATDKDTGTCRVRASMTALIRNAEGEIVNKVSRDAPYEAPLDRIEELRRGNVVFTGPFFLPPGRYTIETVVVDRETLKSSAMRASLVVPAGIRVSNLSVARRVEPAEDPAARDPWIAPAGKVVPSVSGSVSGKQVALYAVMYPDGSANPPEAALELRRDGKVLVRSALPLPPPNAGGAIPMLASVPADRFEPGQYEARVFVRQGAYTAEEMTVLTLR